MWKKLFEWIRRIIFSFLLLYGYNLLASSIGVSIPINFITVAGISILGVPALFSFILIFMLIF